VPLNRIDGRDEHTVLDFLTSEISQSQGQSYEHILRGYYQTLRNAGALYAHEVRAQGGG
jgi:hypothetical protein